MGGSWDQPKLALARIERAPRFVRTIFVAALLMTVGTTVLVPITALLLVPFDPPGVFAAGSAQLAIRAHERALILLLSAPIILGMFLDEDYGAWRTVRGAIGRIATWLVVLPFMLLSGAMAFGTIFYLALPFLTNAVSRPAVQTWDVPITSVKRQKRDPRNCSFQLNFTDPLAADHELSLCAQHQPELAGAEVGDKLRITGRGGMFGITYSKVELLDR